MSVLNKSLRTNWALWASVSVILFVLLGFVNPIADVSKPSESYWELWIMPLQPSDYPFNWEEYFTGLVLLSLVRAVPAVIVGWALQAIVVAGIAGIRTLATRKST